MKLAKNTIKKWSTWANLVSTAIAGVMIYIPDLIPVTYQPKVMLTCTVIVAIAQWCKQSNLEAVFNE